MGCLSGVIDIDLIDKNNNLLYYLIWTHLWVLYDTTLKHVTAHAIPLTLKRTMFGYQAENRGVGITGGVDFVELDGPTVVLHLKGRFWHQRPTVLQRVGSYLMSRIPEIVDVVVEDEWELTDEANDLAI